MKPRILMIGRTRYRLPLDDSLARKFDALDAELDVYVLASSAVASSRQIDRRFRLLRPLRPRVVDGIGFYVRLVPEVLRALRTVKPDVVVADSPYTGALALVARRFHRGRQPAVAVEVHGDWRVSTRLYGSRLRHLAAPVGDRIATSAVRRADAVRALSGFTGGLVQHVRGEAPDAVFPTYSDLGAFADQPPQPFPETPTALFVGALERYKNVDGIAAAWPQVMARLPQARLVLVGSGSSYDLIAPLLAAFPDGVEHHAALSPPEVARRMDGATVLLLPSRFEGLGRVVIESFARGRGVVGGASGGILDLVDDEVEGLLVDPEDASAIAAALIRVLDDAVLATRFGAAARARYDRWHSTPEEFARNVRGFVERAAERRNGREP